MSWETQSAFWKGRRVFLTGHTGFKGSWLAHWLLMLGAEVRGFSLAPESGQVPDGFKPLFEELDLGARLDHLTGDVRDEETLKRSLRAFNPEVVLHLAAQPLVRASYQNPVETYATNVMGTAHLLNACRSVADLRSIVVVSSDKCYENREQLWAYREIDPMGGHDPYSSSKGCAELVTSAFRASYFPTERADEHGVSISSARAGNVIGGGDWSEDRLIPDAMRSMLAGSPLEIRNPRAVRPWQHVLEPLQGYLKLAYKGAEDPALFSKGWNFGPVDGDALPVGDLADRLAAKMHEKFSWKTAAESGPHEAQLLALDSTAARALLDWKPALSLQGMMDFTASWYSCRSLEQRVEMVSGQITQYTRRLKL
ncbi:CDP-glucose 4,6-dehydratase [Phaeobacter inhibens]|uniref:CDP-glucose 4,6-dehydratase n=1 Tax=Phaeobacter inhibens TaxID=221822 RepID=UPI0021A3AEFB|nr:CDP-glucose 4,6-dehydratase [Phaeobacter inhibens]UWR55993.1 CDP-glucose 4,6-dehydratase [Phaeobacter inhibens]